MKIKILPFDPDDLVEISKVDLECFGLDEAYPMSFFRQAQDIFGDFLYVAKNDQKKIIGYLIGAINPTTNQGWIFSLCVLPSYQRKGVAKSMILTFVQELGRIMVPELLLTVSPHNQPAIGLYKMLGFNPKQKIEDYFGPGKTKIIFKKRIL